MQSASELAYVQTALALDLRSDGRSKSDYRPFELQTGVAPQANGSAQVSVGGSSIIVGCKLETQDSQSNGKVECSVACLPAALECLSADPSATLATYMANVFAFLSQNPQLSIIRDRKSWILHLDALILSADGGNLHDALIIAARSALWDLKIPQTRGIGYDSKKPSENDDETEERDVDMVGFKALLKGKKGGKGNEIDFELASYWDEGEILQDRALLPVSVTLNLSNQEPFLDATRQEEEASPVRLFLAINGRGNVCTIQQEGSGELASTLIDFYLDAASEIARQLIESLNAKLETLSKNFQLLSD